MHNKRSEDCALPLHPPCLFFSPSAFWVAGCVFWLQAKASSCCNVHSGTFGAKGLNKNLYSGKKSHVKEPKALPHVCCIMSCCPHFSLGANRYGTEVNSASSIHIYHFSKGCSREDEDQYKFIFSGNGKYLNCSAIRHKDDFWGYRACVLSHCPDNSRRV